MGKKNPHEYIPLPSPLIVPTAFRMDVSLKRRAEFKAKALNISLTRLVHAALEMFLDRIEEEAKKGK